MSMYDLIVIDAGVSTGLVHARKHVNGAIEILALHQRKHEDWRRHVDDIRMFLNNAKMGYIVYESFNLRPHNKFLPDLTTVKVNSSVEYLLFDRFAYDRFKLVSQTPAQGKGLASDEVLKNLGWWPTGKTVGAPDANDVRDALRHLVFFEAKTKRNLWVTREGWPH